MKLKSWKKFRPERDSNPWPLQYQCSALLTKLSSHCELVTLWVRNILVGVEKCKWIYEGSYIWTAEKDMNFMIDYRSCTHNLSSCYKIKAWKKKYMIPHISIFIFQLLRVYYKLTKWPAPSGLIAQSAEHCTGITEVMGLNPAQAWMFFQALISQLLKLCVQLQWSIINSYLSLQFKYMIPHIFVCIMTTHSQTSTSSHLSTVATFCCGGQSIYSFLYQPLYYRPLHNGNSH